MSHRAKANRHPLLNPPLDGGAGGGGGAASSGLLVHAELRCALCGGGSKAERGALGPLLGPINIASSSSTTATTATGHRRHRTNRPPPLGRYVHRLCALWCPEVFQGADGAYRRVAEAVRRARQIKCAACGKAGAATGCRVHSCPLSFHLPCARDAGCAFNGERFVLACPEHAPMFAREAGAAGAPADEARREDEAEAAATKSNKRPAAASNANNKNNKRGRHRAPPPRLLDAAAIGQRLAGARAALDRAVAEEADPAVAEALRAVFGGGGGAGGSSSAAGPSACPFAAAEAAENSVIDDDEAAFRRKEARRDAKDRARLAPIILGGDVLRRPRCRPRRAVLAVHGPETPESEREEERRRWIPPELGLRAVGGLEDAKRQLFEAAVLPLCHPSIVESLFGGGGNGTATSATTTTSGGTANLAPPRGVLLHGPPGTGKTHLVRAVAGEIARRLAIMVEEEEGFDPEADAAAAEAAAEEIAAGGYYPHHYARGRRPERLPIPTVALFARKGADCLGKYAGDAERSLRLLFDEATRMQPSIIFLDEIDALAPARAARVGTIDQTYASVVATLLALMDGADAGGGAGGGRGKRVVVIAATNRPDAIDPALRRPGRFDREVYVGLPSAEERADILRVMTRGWPCLPRDEDVAAADGNGGNGGNGNAQQQQAAELSALPPALLQELAASTEGYAGADLKALCTGAVMAALRRCAPRCLAAGAEGRARGRAPPLPLGQATTGVGNLRVASPHDEDGDDDDMEDDEDDEDEEQAPAAAATAAEEEEAAAPAAATAPAPTSADPDAAGPSNGNANETNNNTNNNDPNFLHTLRETLADLRSPGTGVVAAAGAPAAAPPAAAAAPTGAAPAAAAPAINLLTRSVSPSPMQHGDSDGADDDESDDDDDDDSDSPSPHALPLHLQRQRPLPPPEQLVVLARDWRAALAAAPPPASLRGADAAPSAGGGAGPGSGAPLPAPLAPLLLPSLARALARLHASGLPLPRRGRLAVAAAEAARGNLTRLARLLRRCGAIEADDEEEDNGKANSGGNDDNDEEAPTAAATATNAPPPPHGPQCRLLISGDGDAGQAETAAALLRAVRLGWQPRVSPGSENGAAIATAFAAVFPPPVVAALTLPALLLRGRGDAASGCASMVKEALESCSGPRQALVLFAPCVEAWAVAANVVVSGGAGGEEGGEGDGGEGEGAATPTPTPPQPTLAWTVFERALVDASPDRPILVVATTQAPESLLPEGVRRFFFLPTAAAGAADGGTTPATATSTAAASSSTAFARAARAAASRAAAFLRERASDLALAAAGAQEQQQKEGEEQDNADAEDDAEESDPEAAAAAEEALRGWELRVGLNAAQREVADRALAHALACTSALGRALLNPTWAHALNFGFRGAAGAGGGGANGGNNAPTTPPIRAVAERAAEGGYCCLDEMLVDIRLAANAARRAAGLASGAAAAAAAEAAAAEAAEAEAAAAEAPTTTRRPRRGSGRASTAPSTPPPPPVPARYSRAAAAVAAAEDMAEAALAEGAAGLWAAAVGGGGEGGGNGGLGGGGAAALLLQPPGAGAGAGAAGATPIDPAVAAAELRRLMGLAQAAWRSARSAQMEEKWFMGPRPPSSQLVSSDRNKNNNNNKKKKQGEAGAGAAGANKRGRQAAPPSSSPPSSSEEQQQPASAPPLPPPALTPLAALLVGSEAEATADALEAAIAAELRRLLLPAAAKAAAEAAEAAARAAEEGGNDGHDTASVLVPALRQFCRAVGPAWWEATASLAPFGEGVVMEEEEEEEETEAAAAAASTADAALVVAAAARRAARAAARALSP